MHDDIVPLSVFVLALVPSVILWAGQLVVKRAGKQLIRQKPESVLRWTALLRLVPLRGFRAACLILETSAYSQLKDHDRAADRARRTLKASALTSSLELTNLCVCTFVTTGAYTEALACTRAWPAADLEKSRIADARAFGLTLINQAEALHNLNRDTEAHSLLDDAAAIVRDYPLGWHGLHCLRA